MSKAPSMPMYWDAYLADTTHLTTEEHGAYLLLLGAMWRRNGTVPDDDKDNARILGLTKGKWLKIKQRLSDFLIYENNHISQKKLQKTWKKTQETIQKNRQNGAKGGRPKTNKNNDLGKAVGSDWDNPNDNPNVTIPEPEPLPKEKNKKREKISHADIVSLWHKICNKSPKIIKITPDRTKHLNARIAEDLKTIEEWENCFKQIASSEFLTGQNHNWFNFDWVINPNNIAKVLEGKYQNNGYGSPDEQIYHTDEGWEVVVKKYQESGTWYDEWGREPDMNGNRVPEYILRENGFNTTTEAGK